MSVDLFFGTPLVVTDVDATIREAIRQKVYAYLESEKGRRDVTPAPEESVSTSFYLREKSILVDAGLQELEAAVLDAARGYLERTLKLAPRALEIEHAWINVFEPGSQEGQHSHDGSLLSCSYYVDAPPECGCIVFPDPIGARRSYREFTETAGSELLNRREIAVEPQPGRFVMFESWMPHYIQCNKSDKVRISIAINLREAKSVAAAPRDADVELVATSDEPEPTAEVSQPADASPSVDQAPAAPRPFLFNELFALNAEPSLEVTAISDSIPVAVIDNLLQHPERVRELIGSSPAANWKHEPGGRNFIDYYDCRLRFPIRYPNPLITVAQQVIKRVANCNTRPADPSVDVNWFMQINEKRADFAIPHNDMTENVTRSFTCIVYLNSPEESSGGTAFFKFLPSNSLTMDEAYARAVTKDGRVGETGHDYWPDDTLEHWEQIGEVEMKPGRMMIFPSEFFHSAWHPLNSFYDFPRMTLAFWMIP